MSGFNLKKYPMDDNNNNAMFVLLKINFFIFNEKSNFP